MRNGRAARPAHRRPKRRSRDVLRDDLRGLLGVRAAVTGIRRSPGMLLRWLVYLLTAYLVTVLGLLAVGHLALIVPFAAVPFSLASAPIVAALLRENPIVGG